MPESIVGVVVPLYESEGTIEATLASLRSQSLESWRAVVVDDGSTDDGPSIARRVSREDPRVAVVSQANAGLSAARNRGLDGLACRFVAFLDADDILHPEAYKTLARAAEAGGTGAAYCGYEFLDADAEPIGRETAASAPVVGLDELLDWNRFVVHSQLLSRDLLGTERFDETLTSSEDYDLWLRLAGRGVRWSGVEGYFGAGYRIRAGSMSKDYRRMAANEGRVLSAAFNRALVDHVRGAHARIDASELREARSMTCSALAYATRRALCEDDQSVTAARSIFAEHRRGWRVDAASVASASVFAIQFGAAAAPTIVLDDPARWMMRLEKWWEVVAMRGWAGQGHAGEFVESVRRAMACTMLHPRDVARAVMEDASGEEIDAPERGAGLGWMRREARGCGIAVRPSEAGTRAWEEARERLGEAMHERLLAARSGVAV